jgi:hypothetical protein
MYGASAGISGITGSDLDCCFDFDFLDFFFALDFPQKRLIASASF